MHWHDSDIFCSICVLYDHWLKVLCPSVCSPTAPIQMLSLNYSFKTAEDFQIICTNYRIIFRTYHSQYTIIFDFFVENATDTLFVLFCLFHKCRQPKKPLHTVVCWSRGIGATIRILFVYIIWAQMLMMILHALSLFLECRVPERNNVFFLLKRHGLIWQEFGQHYVTRWSSLWLFGAIASAATAIGKQTYETLSKSRYFIPFCVWHLINSQNSVFFAD